MDREAWIELYTYRAALKRIAERPTEPWLQPEDDMTPQEIARLVVDDFPERQGPVRRA